MIEFFRKLSHSLGAKIFFGVLALCFIFLWGGNEGLQMLSRSNDGSVAKVGSHKIKTTEFYQELEQAAIQIQLQTDQHIDPQAFQNSLFYNQLLNQIIVNELLNLENQEQGINVSDEYAAQEIKKQDLFKDQSQRFSKERFLQIIRRLGFKNESDYIKRYKRDVSKMRLLHSIAVEVKLPEFYQDILYGWDQQVRSLEGIIIDVEAIDSVVEPTEKELRSYYGENRKYFFANEARTFDVLVIDHRDLNNNINTTDAEIELIFQAEKDSTYKNIDHSKAIEQIRSKANFEKLMQKVEELGKKIEQSYDQGQSLQNIAKLHQLSIEQYDNMQLKVNSKEQNERVTQFVKASFEQEENTLGYLLHLKGINQSVYIIVNKVIAAHPQNYREAISDIRSRLIFENKFRLAQNLAENLRKESLGGKPLISLVKESLFKFTSFKVNRAGVLQPSSMVLQQDIVNKLFNLEVGQVVTVPNLSADSNKIMVLKVTDIKKPELQSEKNQVQEEFKQQLSAKYYNDLFTVYIDALKQHFPITVNEKLLEKMAQPQAKN